MTESEMEKTRETDTNKPAGYRLPYDMQIVHVPQLELATVTRETFGIRTVVFDADGPDAFEQCEEWARENYPAE